MEALNIMLCEVCHKNEATVHLTQKRPGQPEEKRHLCAVCFPGEGTDADQIRAAAKQFGMDLPPDIEIRETEPHTAAVAVRSYRSRDCVSGFKTFSTHVPRKEDTPLRDGL